jgi:3-oxoadipate enol-lactonase
MPHLRVNGTELHYEDTGGPGPAVVFSHGLLWSGRMFASQMARLAPLRRCIAYDHRGQGRSAPASEPVVSIETCYADAAALIEALGVAPCDFVGLSMGGFVGMRLAARRPELIRRLVLLETSADPEPPENVGKYKLLSLVAEHFGLRPVAGRVMPIMFGKTFMKDPARAAERDRWRRELLGNRRDIVRAVRGVITRTPILPELGSIRAPTLVLVGEEDTATVPAKAERIVSAIAGARLERIPRAGHSSSVEEPDAVSDAIERFLQA